MLRHELSEVREISGVPFRTCRPEEEEQATNFGDTLLLPRPLLIAAARQDLGPEAITEKYNVTIEMARDGALSLQLHWSPEQGGRTQQELTRACAAHLWPIGWRPPRPDRCYRISGAVRS